MDNLLLIILAGVTIAWTLQAVYVRATADKRGYDPTAFFIAALLSGPFALVAVRTAHDYKIIADDESSGTVTQLPPETNTFTVSADSIKDLPPVDEAPAEEDPTPTESDEVYFPTSEDEEDEAVFPTGSLTPETSSPEYEESPAMVDKDPPSLIPTSTQASEDIDASIIPLQPWGTRVPTEGATPPPQTLAELAQMESPTKEWKRYAATDNTVETSPKKRKLFGKKSKEEQEAKEPKVKREKKPKREKKAKRGKQDDEAVQTSPTEISSDEMSNLQPAEAEIKYKSKAPKITRPTQPRAGICASCGTESYPDWYGLCANCNASFLQ